MLRSLVSALRPRLTLAPCCVAVPPRRQLSTFFPRNMAAELTHPLVVGKLQVTAK